MAIIPLLNTPADRGQMEEEIRQAVALLIKHGLDAQSISTSMSAGPVTKISMEFVILEGNPRDAVEKKIAFERAWFQKKPNG